MKALHLFSRIAVVAVAGAFLLSCAGAKPSPKERPDWVVKGSRAFKRDGNQAIYGVGAVTGVKNEPLARTTAQNRARAEITKIFETYTASLMKDYAASTTGGAAVNQESPTIEEQHIEQAIKTFSAATLSGVEIVDQWKDPSDASLYALARLDMDQFKNNLDKMKELSADVRDFVRKNAEKAFDDLSEEEEKRGM
jgi:hypothetical protein